MSAVVCPLSGCAQSKLLHSGCRSRRTSLSDRFDVYLCPECRTGFLHPFPSPAQLAAVYSEEYHSHRPIPGAQGALARMLRSICLFPYRLRFGDESPLPHPSGEGRLLDVGCGVGEFLHRMEGLGWTCSGCDVSETALQAARQRAPQAWLFPGSLEQASFPPGSFELVTLWHTLEHLPDPRGTLSRIHRLLAPGGRLLIALPNLEGWEARILGIRWFEVDIPGHLFFYTAAGLRDLLEKTGFAVERIRPQVHPSTVSDSVDFLLDDLLGLRASRQRMGIYYGLFPLTVLSYTLGNWGCIEVAARKRG